MAKFVCLVLPAFLCIAGVVGQTQPRAQLYPATDCRGPSVDLPTDTYSPDLAIFGFDNQAFSVSALGPWLFFDNVEFNSGGNALMEYIFRPTHVCVNFRSIAGFVSSAKYVGTRVDYTLDTITFYANTFFQGNEEYAEFDLPNLSLSGNIASLIITGSSAWTIYDLPNYEGQAICLQPEFSPDYEPAFVADTIELDPTVPHGTISSVRKGCFSSKLAKVVNSITANVS